MSKKDEKTDSKQSNQVPDFVREAGAKDEADTARDGFLSYKSETHALVVGAGAGFWFAAGGNAGLIGPVVAAVSAGLRGKAAKQPSVVLTDVKTEPHYALGGVVVGVLLGIAYRVAAGLDPVASLPV